MKKPHQLFILDGHHNKLETFTARLNRLWGSLSVVTISSWAGLDHDQLEWDRSIFLLIGGFANAEAVAQLRELTALGGIVVCAEDGAWQTAVACLQAGADDFFVSSSDRFDVPLKKLEGVWDVVWKRHTQNSLKPKTTPEKSSELQALYDMALATTGVLSTHELIDLVYDYIQRLLAPDTFAAAIYDEKAQNYEVILKAKDGVSLKNGFANGRLDPQDESGDSGVTGWVIRERQSLHVKDLEGQSRVKVIPFTNRASRTWLGAPLLVYNQVVGAVSIHAFEPDVFTDDQVSFFYALVNQLSLALHGAHLHQTELVRRQQTEALYRLSGQLMTANTEEDIFDCVRQAIGSTFPHIGAVSLSLLNAKRTDLVRSCAWLAEGLHAVADGLPLEVIQEFSYDVAMSKRTRIVEDVQQTLGNDDSSAWSEMMCALGLQSSILLPLFIKGEVTGILSLDFLGSERHFTPVQIQLAESIGGHAAVAMESVRLHKSELSRRKYAEILHQLSSQLINTTDRQPVFDQVVRATRAILPNTVNISFLFLDETKMRLWRSNGWWSDPKYDSRPNEQLFALNDIRVARQAMEEARTIIVEDVHAVQLPHPNNLSPSKLLMERGLSATINLPLIIQGEVIGVVWIAFWDEPQQFSTIQIQSIESVAHHAAIAMENVRLHEQELEQRRHAEILHRLSSKLIDAAALKTIFSHVLEAIQSIFPHVGNIHFSLFDEEKKYLTRVGTWSTEGTSTVTDSQKRFLVADLPLVQQLLHDGKLFVFENTTDLIEPTIRVSPLMREWIEKGLATFVNVPLLVKGECIGIFRISWTQHHEFTVTELKLVESVSGYAAVAIENVRLYEMELIQRRHTEILHRLSSRLINTADATLIFDLVVETVRQIFPDADDVSFSIVDRKWEYLIRTNSWFSKPHYDVLGDEKAIFRIADLKLGRIALEQANTVYVEDILQLDLTYENEDSPSKKVIDEGIRGVIYLPLVVKGSVVGLLGVVFWNKPRYFSADEIQMIEGVAGHAAVAMENTRLYDELNQRVYELSILRDVALLCTASVNLDELIENMTQVVSEALYRHDFGIYLVDKRQKHLFPHHSYRRLPEGRNYIPVPIEGSLFGRCLATQQPYLSGNLLDEVTSHLVSPAVRSLIVAPIIVDGDVVAVINAESPEYDAFGDGDFAFLTVLAGQMSTAWKRVSLHEEIQQQATQLSVEVARRTAELQAERDRVQIILESAGEGILFTDTEGLIAYANPALVQQSGYGVTELIGQPASLLGGNETESGVFYQMWQTILTGERWRGELVNQHKNGDLYTVVMIITPIHNQDGDVDGFVSVQSDITHLKEVERLKTEFVSNVSHELRTPLTNINMYLTLLQRGREDRKSYYFSVLERETARLTQLIQDLLDLSRLDMEKGLELTIVDLEKLLHQVVQDFLPQAEAKQIKLTSGFSPNLPEVWGDIGQIQQVLVNLLANALAYTPQNGSISALLMTCINDDSERIVCIKIKDTGLGIASSEFDFLFDRFYRGSAAQEARAAGTGLGLAVCHEIMVRHKGGVTVDSVLGEGAEFTVWFPPYDSVRMVYPHTTQSRTQ